MLDILVLESYWTKLPLSEEAESILINLNFSKAMTQTLLNKKL